MIILDGDRPNNSAATSMQMQKLLQYQHPQPVCTKGRFDEKFRKIFIGGLSPKTDEKSLGAYFSKWGELVDCVVMKDSQKRRSRGFGFITYKDPKNVDLAQSFRPHEIDGKLVESKRAMPREDSNSPEAHLTVKKLYVAQIPLDMCQQLICAHFSQFGLIVSFEFDQASISNYYERQAFIVFDDYDSVDKAVLHQPHIIAGFQLTVRKALTLEQMQAVNAKYHSLHLHEQYQRGQQQKFLYQLQQQQHHHQSPQQNFQYPTQPIQHHQQQSGSAISPHLFPQHHPPTTTAVNTNGSFTIPLTQIPFYVVNNGTFEPGQPNGINIFV